MKKEARKYLIIAVIIAIAIGILFLVSNRFTGNILTGWATYGIAGAPTISSVSISPSNPTPDDDLTGSVSASDPEGDNITYWYSWYKNGSLSSTTLIDTNLVSYFPLDNDALDYYGDNDGTNSGATPTIGKVSEAYSFDGTNDYINCGNNASLNIRNTITIIAWVNPVALSQSAQNSILGKPLGYWFFVSTSKKLTFLRFNENDPDTGYGKFSALSTDENIPTASWTHVAATYDTTAGNNVKLYMNGELKKSINFTNGAIDSTATNVEIGKWMTSHYFNGKIDEVMIFNRVLSETEIQQLYQGGVYGSVLDSSYTGEGDEWELKARAGDYTGWSSEESSGSVMVLYNQAPTIELIFPENTLYSENESLALNFSVYDDRNAIEDLTCWYNINNRENISINNCENITFDVSDANTYTLNIFVSDSEGLEASDSVSFSVDALGVSVLIIQPLGAKTSRTEIPLQYTAIGHNLTCWYGVETSVGEVIINDTFLADCIDTVFNISDDGNYILNLYANNTFGNTDLNSSNFSVDTDSEASSSGGGGGRKKSSVNLSENISAEVTAENIQDLILGFGDTQEITWKIKNTGDVVLNDCEVRGEGGYSDWIIAGDIVDIKPEEESNFILTINIPKEINAGKHKIGVLLNCQEINERSEFSVEVLEKKLNFELIEAVRKKGIVSLTYSLEEIAGISQNVDLHFILFDSDNHQIAEISNNIIVEADSKNEYGIILPVDSSLKGEFKLLVNINSDIYSGLVEESLVLGKSGISGFSIFRESQKIDNIIAFVLIAGFFVFAIFIIRKILKSQKK